ncbi:MAG: hypothetical protein AAF950_18260 [Pseudomonadota bacterium]
MGKHVSPKEAAAMGHHEAAMLGYLPSADREGVFDVSFDNFSSPDGKRWWGPTFHGTFAIYEDTFQFTRWGPDVELNSDEVMEVIVNRVQFAWHLIIACSPEKRKLPKSYRRPPSSSHGSDGVSYYVLDIGKYKPKCSAAMDGTHASPRWHLRRGHTRTLKSGKVTWVRECEVGDISRGAVIKDYKLQ